MTAGQEFAATARRYFKIGPTTRRYRGRQDLHAEVAEAVSNAATLPGYFTEATQAALAPAYAAVGGYQKHILGYRSSPATCLAVTSMTPYRFVAMLAAMVDAGVSNMGEAERFFQANPQV